VPTLESRSFFLRVLPEDPGTSVSDPVRRGYVLELPDGAKRWFRDLDQIPGLIAALLAGERPDHEQGD
jgi:hypothetical protein